ncbi:Reverse transcriptase (RNA-dependent DNA polymerase) [Popillia japonica]|uniref:Reverse transcriptase (RNA-dependent DNA polymerase) n=1 Tax=Popillia japonica TaxID=7064 RepID=A0AAW1IFQ4_POPJA
MWVELGLEYSPLDKPIVIRGFGQGLAKAIGKLTTEIKIDEAVALTEILVVSDNFQEIPLLVGQPFTDQDHIVIIRRGNALRIFEDNEVDKTSLSNLTIPELPHAKVSIWAKDADIIPSNFVGFVKVYTPCKIDADLYVEKRTEFDTCIPRCIIKFNDVDETQIPILNLSNRDIAIKKGQRMIRADVCTEDGREKWIANIKLLLLRLMDYTILQRCHLDLSTDQQYFTKMPFGLVNGPAMFQRLVNSVLGPLRFTIAMAYMDDILLPSKTMEEGLVNLAEVLKVLKRANLFCYQDSSWEWNARHRDSFELLKQELISDNVLAMYSPTAYTEIHTDSSNLGLGGIMLQKDGNGQMRPVIALRSTFAKKHMIPRIARWWLKIQECSFEVQHRAGMQMCHVDALSRNPVDPGEDTEGAQGLTVLYQTLDEPDWLTLA